MTEETKPKENPYGYDSVNEVSQGGRYLSFKKGDKGRIIQIRLASEPRYIQQHWIEGDNTSAPVPCLADGCTYCGKEVKPDERLKKTAKWGWIVIDREDENIPIKIFTGPTLISRNIKEISELKNIKTGNVMWGNPLTYDIQIERTEEPGGSYYKVTPVVEGKGEITKEELEKIKEADFNLEAELADSKKSENTGNYASKEPIETAPDEEIKPEDIPEDLDKEVPSKNADGDDLPF